MKIVILGNGIAGTNAARFIRKRSDHSITMISDESWQPFSRPALMYVFMDQVKLSGTYLYEDWFWEKNRIDRVMDRVIRVDFEAKRVLLQRGDMLDYDTLIVATGSLPCSPGVPGEALEGVQGLYHLQDVESMERMSAALIGTGRRAVVVGGGLIGVEMAEMLHARRIPVTFLVREKSFWQGMLPPEEGAMIARHIRSHGIDLQFETALVSVEGDAQGRVSAVVQSGGAKISCGFVGLAVGVAPNVNFLRDGGIEMNRGILVDAYLATSQPDVYAIGDCAELRKPALGRRSIEAVWYTGRMMGQTVAATICGEKTEYSPGIWFNSAKFFDLEYQVYGDVPAQLPACYGSLYWEHPGGTKSIRINYDKETGVVTGFCLIGIRYRQEVCERWMKEQALLETVLANLSWANFDPEFSIQYEQQVVEQYNRLKGF
jgi:NADPH-dependent 2,4-dienoyl-CoA reductase/sulfur reductase-like enzyme